MAESKRFSRRQRGFVCGSALLFASIGGGPACSLTDFDRLSAGLSAGSTGFAGYDGADPGAAGESGEANTSADAADPGLDPGADGSDAGTTNLFANAGFEDSPAIWGPMGSCVTSLVSDNPRSGDHCLLTSQRTAAWEGPGYPLIGVLRAGETYAVVVWARAEVGTYPLTLTHKRRCTDDPPAGVYTQLATRAVTAEWTELSGILVAPDCLLLESMVYVEAAPAGESFCIDDTSLERLP